jgi:peptidoglycan-associated lipoprotein
VNQKELAMKTHWAHGLAVVCAAMGAACTSAPLAEPDPRAPTLVIRTPGSTLWTTAEAEAAAARAAPSSASTPTSAPASAKASKDLPKDSPGRANATTRNPPVAQKEAQPAVVAAGPTQPAPVDAADPSGLVFFEFDSAEIGPAFAAVLEARAKVLAADRTLRLVVEGHADERGGAEYNLALGQKRAEAIVKALKLLGAQEDQLEAVSFGDTRPYVREQSEAAWAKNRRAEIKAQAPRM